MEETFAEVVLALRTSMGLSRQRFAQALKVAVTTVQGWERFGRLPSGPHLTRLVEMAPQWGPRLLGAVGRAGLSPEDWARLGVLVDDQSERQTKHRDPDEEETQDERGS